MNENNDRKFFCNIINETQKKQFFEDFYVDVNGYVISSEAKKEFETDSKSLTYGEVTYEGLKEVLDIIQPKENSVFYDLGSGTGKALLVSALAGPFAKINGVELLPKLYDASLNVKDYFLNFLNEKYQDAFHPTIEIKNQNIEDSVFSDADVVLINSTCFDSDLIDIISQKAEGLKKGSHFISFTKSLNSDQFEIIHQEYHKMGWGSPTVYVHKKIA
ncbi:MAG: hypothetical protein CMP39_00930 [Rickettsiales bacterium]|nr:hypothetical protein [Rickettsiales bacterium]|tara:strand:+ start:2179 stop:2829 length:651 start_codon:yes stop_codon:yes gene_type:complete